MTMSLESSPRRVPSVRIWKGLAFWASSKSTTEPDRSAPRTSARFIISMTPSSRSFW